MKLRIPALIIALAGTASAEPSALEFPDRKIEVPPLSLAERGREAQTPQPFANDSRQLVPPGVSRAVLRAAPRSNMPIVKPKAYIDPKFIEAPDTTVDYKLLIIKPKIETSSEPKEEHGSAPAPRK